ncbi:MAG: hypothetical protein NZ893_01320 [Candidatus Aenigmarchaeota archaeon]|nr:hypothetical protein [Candidatus Aenigmarchaeota archaeon]
MYIYSIIHKINYSPHPLTPYESSNDIKNFTNPITHFETDNRIIVKFSYYNPLCGGINCDLDCTTTADGTTVIDENGNLIGAWNGREAYAACPSTLSFGTKVYVFRDREHRFFIGTFECRDRGSKIIVDKKDGVDIYILDILHNGDCRGGEWPVTSDGYRIRPDETYYGYIDLQKTPQNQTNQTWENFIPTDKSCYSNYLARLGKNPYIPEGMCPPPGWKSWCPPGYGREDGAGRLVSIDEIQPQPGVNCYTTQP